jgi:hypothetical protein
MCACADDYPATYWWTWPERMDDAGIRAIAAMSELCRRDQSIERFQTAAGLVADGLVGPRTLGALGITA